MRNAAELQSAVEAAHAGDEIVLADGKYMISAKLHARASGTPTAPITVRAEHARAALVWSTAEVAFEVTGANWHFADLDVAGACSEDTKCEHAFHVVGAATGFQLQTSRLADFNAHLKVNADGARVMPGAGLVAGNEFYDSHARHTDNPVAPVNIDNAVGWIVRGNLIHDFQKDGKGEGSYGAFVKGGSSAPVIERNFVLCARDRAATGHMVGLSFGAHGMDPKLCPPHWDAAVPCDPEVSGGVMRNNIVVNCNDDGIYLNRASGSAILFNTLVQTAGIEFRFPSSTGEARGNLMTGAVRATGGGKVSDTGNAAAVANAATLGAWFHAPAPAGRLLSLPGPDARLPDDYCGRSRGATLDVGALQASSGTCLFWR